MDEWIEIDINKDRLFRSQIYEEEINNPKHNLIDNIVERCVKYGKLDNHHQIARKTGAMHKDADYEKDQNVYDQEDSFIDDEDIEKENHGMVIPETELEDYHLLNLNLKDFVKSAEYRQRLAIIKKHSNEPKNKSAKKRNKAKEKAEVIIEQQKLIPESDVQGQDIS